METTLPISQARIALNQSVPDDSDEDTQPTWAERQTDYTGIDPLLCPHCDKPLTFVGSLFGNRNELKSLFDIAGKDSTIPPALLRPGEPLRGLEYRNPGILGNNKNNLLFPLKSIIPLFRERSEPCIMWIPFKRIRCQCTFCAQAWRIPRRRILRFEKFFEIKKGQPFVWECPVCVQRTGRHDCHACPPSLSLRRGGREGVVIPETYKNIHGEIVKACP